MKMEKWWMINGFNCGIWQQVGGLTEIWQKYGRNMGEIWEKYDRNMTEIWEKYGRNMTEIWEKYGRNVTEIWQKYDSNMGEIWQKCRRNMTEIWHDRNMGEIGQNYLHFLKSDNLKKKLLTILETIIDRALKIWLKIYFDKNDSNQKWLFLCKMKGKYLKLRKFFERKLGRRQR